MQIIAGRFRGRRLISPPGTTSRPTLGRVREALFNILASGMDDSDFLDLYAGAGGIGLEAFSRGSRRVLLVESDRLILRTLTENARLLDPAGRDVTLLPLSADSAVRRLLAEGARFDYVFLDPPYRQGEARNWESAGNLDRLLKPDGLLIYQHGKREELPELWAGCRKVKERAYGRTILSFFARTDDLTPSAFAGG